MASAKLHGTTGAIGVLLTLLLGACASTGGVPRPFPAPGGTAGRQPEAGRAPDNRRPATPGTDIGYALTSTALALRGTPYRNGGTDPADGFDCSGFTQYVFARNGVSLPREVRDQFRVGRKVKPEDVEAGDLLFFTTIEPGASHVGIAIGGDEFVHAPSSKGVVRVERLSVSYWSRRYLGARRINP